MTIILRHGIYRAPFECRRLPLVVIRDRRWLAVFRIFSWSIILTGRP